MCRCQASGSAEVFGVARKVVLVGLVASSTVEADDRGVQVQILVNRVRLSDILGKSEPFGEKHKRIGQNIVHFSVSFPKRAIFWILWPVVRSWAVDML